MLSLYKVIKMKKTASILLALAMIASAVGLGSCGSDSKGGQVSIQATTEPELKDEFGVGFKVSDDGTLSVSSYTSDDKDVSIPDEFDGKPVKSVGQSAFKGQDITTVTMPDGLEEIGNSFEGVENCYAIQAGRELRVIVQPEKISEDRAAVLAHDMAERIEKEMRYPGQVRVSVIRETRAVDFAK